MLPVKYNVRNLKARFTSTLPWPGAAGKPKGSIESTGGPRGRPLASQTAPCRLPRPMMACGREPTRTIVKRREEGSTSGRRELEPC